MKRKIISMLMALVILLTAVDLTAFASEATVSGNEVQSVVEEVADGVEETEGEETTVSENDVGQGEGTSEVEETEVEKETDEEADSGGSTEEEEQDSAVDNEGTVEIEESENESTEDELAEESVATSTEVIQEDNVENSVVFEGGDGTIEDSYQISNAEQLDAIRNDLSANYVLINDIDLTEYGSWNPIGVEDDFSGSLEGNNYKIIRLTLDNTLSLRAGLLIRMV